MRASVMMERERKIIEGRERERNIKWVNIKLPAPAQLWRPVCLCPQDVIYSPPGGGNFACNDCDQKCSFGAGLKRKMRAP